MRDSYTNPSMYESFLIKKNRVILKNKSSEMNPWNESLRFGVTHPDLRVRQPGFIRFQDSQILIFKDSFCAIVLKIREDSWKQVESFENGWICGPRLETNLFKSGFVIHDTKLWYNSRNLTNYTVALSEPVAIKSLVF